MSTTTQAKDTGGPKVSRANRGSREEGFDRAKMWRLISSYGVYAAIVILLIIDEFLLPNFLTMSNLRVQLFQVVPVILVSLGMAMVICTTGVDLAVGAVIALASAIIPITLGGGPFVAMLVALALGIVSGALGGAMVAFAKIQPIVATLSLMIGVRGLAVILNGASAKEMNDNTIDNLGVGMWAGIPQMAWITVVLIAIIAFVIARTTFGRQLVAIGDNENAARLAGLPVRRVLMIVYMASGLLSALAGIMITGHGSYADPANYGLLYELSAITAVVVGGTPLSGGKIRIIGTVAGAILMQLITATLIQRNVAASTTQMVEAVIIIIAVYAARTRGTR